METYRHSQKKEGHVITENGWGDIVICQGTQRAAGNHLKLGRVERFFPRVCKGRMALLNLDFGLLTSRNGEKKFLTSKVVNIPMSSTQGTEISISSLTFVILFLIF